MVALTPIDKSRVRFHLGYSAFDSIPDGDEMRLELAMSRVRDNTQVNYIRFMLEALDDSFNNLLSGGTFSSRQLIQGDINRTTVVDAPQDFRYWREQYLQKTDLLAQQLNVANYARPIEARYRFQRLGSVSIFPAVGHPLGPPDSCLTDRITLSTNYA